jgi:hypothetical protein
MSIQEKVKTFVGDLVENLVDKKNDVNIEVSISTKTILVQIKTAKEDCGKVIGRKGRTIESIKVLTLAFKNTQFPQDSKNISVEIIESGNVIINKKIHGDYSDVKK